MNEISLFLCNFLSISLFLTSFRQFKYLHYSHESITTYQIHNSINVLYDYQTLLK